MYLPPKFKVIDSTTINKFIRSHSFAQLITNVNGVPYASHIPLLLEQGGTHGRLLGHVARANKQWEGFDGKAKALAVFNGPHAYISPNWYISKNIVPTWNYVSIHAYGKPKIISDQINSIDIMRRIISFYENDDTSKWSMDKLDNNFKEKKLKGIVTFEILVDSIEAKFKLSQNHKLQDRRGAIKGLMDTGNIEAREIAQLMNDSLVDED
jgi:transcriptional regulator